MYELDMVNKLSVVLENIDLHIDYMVLTEGAKFNSYKEVAKNTLAKFWEWVVETTKRIYDQIRITLAGRSNAILTKDISIKKACFDSSLLDYNNGLKDNANENIDMKKGGKIDLRKIANTLSIVRSKKNSSKNITSEYTSLITAVLNDCNLLVKSCQSSIVNKITKKNEPEETKKSEDDINKYKTIDKYIYEGNIEHLRKTICNICYISRDFSKKDFDEVVRYVESKGIKLKEDKLVGELVSANKTHFTDNDFTRAVFELKKNFCNERIADVKKIGKAIYGKNRYMTLKNETKDFKNNENSTSNQNIIYESIKKGVHEKDIEGLRDAIGNICYTSSDFSSGDFYANVRYVESKGIKLKEDKLVGELVSANKTHFTNEDFARAVFELQNNFCNERIADAKKIGTYIYKNRK